MLIPMAFALLAFCDPGREKAAEAAVEPSRLFAIPADARRERRNGSEERPKTPRPFIATKGRIS
jgi:hypothetical protein